MAKFKYCKKDILYKCKNIQNRKIFSSTGLRKSAKRLKILKECNAIVDKNKKEIEEKNQNKIFKYLDSEIPKYNSITHFLAFNPKFKYKFYNNKKIKERYKKVLFKQKFSTQQLICKKILERILKEKCVYNTRKILDSRKELDIYFHKFNLAFEYNSFFWHKNKKTDDRKKQKECIKQNITLLSIIEPKLNEYSSLKTSILGIKAQIKKFIPIINQITNLNISCEDVDSVEILQKDFLYNCYTKKDLDYIFNKCNRYSEIKTKYNKIWQYILRKKLLHLLNPVKKRDYIHMKNNDFINWAHKNFKSYTEFSNHKAYQLALKRNLKDKIKILFDTQKTNV